MTKNLFFLIFSFFLCVSVLVVDIKLEFDMPAEMFGPGSTFSLDLDVFNSGPTRNNAHLFVALSIGTGDFWFYPGWRLFPPDIDWETVNVSSGTGKTWSILPAFPWPEGAGAFDGALFLGAIVHNGELISNLADITFGWSETHQPTPTPGQPTPTPHEPTATQTPVPIEFVYISPGRFTMGSPDDEPCRKTRESPQHEVTLTRGLYMMQTQVTRQMWKDLKEVQPDLPYDPGSHHDTTMNHPVQGNTWYESVLFANLKSIQDGYQLCYFKDEDFTIPVDASNYTGGFIYCNFESGGYRLPTEAEWEYACRADTSGPFSCEEPGYNTLNCGMPSCTPGTLPILEQYAAFCANAPEKPKPAGSRLPNPWGLYDMHGNVWEWCWDWYDDYGPENVTDPTGPEIGQERLLRGGSWGTSAEGCRSAIRYCLNPSYRFESIGFRLVRTAP
jgi:formylglycine-generating enzyme required for sulfatase activity